MVNKSYRCQPTRDVLLEYGTRAVSALNQLADNRPSLLIVTHGHSHVGVTGQPRFRTC